MVGNGVSNMNTRSIIVISLAVANLLTVATAQSGEWSIGFEWGRATWREPAWGGGSGSGRYYGPRLAYGREGKSIDRVAFNFRQGELGAADRIDLGLSLRYPLAGTVSVLGEAQYFEYTVDPSGRSRGIGGGVGMETEIPLFQSQFTLVADFRGGAFSVETNGPPGNGEPLYFGAGTRLVWVLPQVLLGKNQSFQLETGYRYRAIRGSGFRERMDGPYVAAGFAQRF